MTAVYFVAGTNVAAIVASGSRFWIKSLTYFAVPTAGLKKNNSQPVNSFAKRTATGSRICVTAIAWRAGKYTARQ